ncbi:MAG: RNA pyrophosphohydrolase [Helicobacteraceae bacterium 4484_230]|nr:MAG: RNA pyrophosphohydrolase [Helicobacteraceae bacterium 4484_230]
MSKKKLYRPNVAAIVMSPEYPKVKKVLLAERSDITGVWQFPQGGIDKGEGSKKALLRELKEEIGTKKVEIIARYPDWLTYDFPKHIAEKMKPYSGQKQRYYLVRLKKKAVIDLDTKHPEFINYKFVEIDKLLENISHFKKSVYKQVIDYFKKEGLL